MLFGDGKCCELSGTELRPPRCGIDGRFLLETASIGCVIVNKSHPHRARSTGNESTKPTNSKMQISLLLYFGCSFYLLGVQPPVETLTLINKAKEKYA